MRVRTVLAQLSKSDHGVVLSTCQHYWCERACGEARKWSTRYTKGSWILRESPALLRLADAATEVEVGQSFVDACVTALNEAEGNVEKLEALAVDAAMAKLWCTEMQGRVVDSCLQLHGGYGYMREYPIARAFADARVSRIYGGSSEIMREIIGRSLRPTT